MTTCAGCGASGQPDGARFCFSCGSTLQAAACPACSAEVVPGARFCSGCGAVQGPTAPTATAGPVASRRITSVLFGDLVGFTSLSEARDQEEVRELLSRYFEECRLIIARYGGTIEKFIGDAVMAVWGVPTAHEDDAERAVRAGLELVARIGAMGSDLAIPDLAMRVGIVTGEVAVTIGAEHQGMVAGDAVNTAARVQSAAAPGQVWVDETTRLLTTSAISYVDVGSHAMKGKADPVPLWSVRAVVAGVGGVQRADGLEAPHIGRDRELRLVKEIFHGVEETLRPALLVVEGEPGIGKSRLGWEFSKYTDGLHTTIRWHSGRCLSYGEGVAFYALAEAIRGRLQILRPEGEDRADGEDDQAELLRLGLDTYVADPEEREWIGPRLGALLGIGAVGTFKRDDLFSAWTVFLRRIGNEVEPVVLVIDDAQHADDGLVAFLEHLLAVASFPVFVLLIARPELLEERPALATNRRATVLHLEALSEREMAALLDGLVVGLPESVRGTLVARAEGVPLFAVETVRSLIDRDLVVPRGGQYVLSDADALDLDAVAAPASLQALIAARLDALPAVERRVLDRASVIGNSFTREEIAGLCPDVDDLGAALAGLVRLQLLRQESDRFSAELGYYQFVQTAVRQVSYGTLSRHDRKSSHLAVARSLEAREDTAGEVASIAAQHYLEALDAVPDAPDVGELATAAVDQLVRAATRAAALGSPSEAAGHLEAAFTRCSDPVQAATLETELADQLHYAGQNDAAIEHAIRARDVFDEHGDPLMAGRAVAVLASALAYGRADFEEAYRIASERFEDLRDRDDAARVALRLSRVRVSALLRTGADLRDTAEEHARYADRIGDESEVADSYISLALHYMVRGPHRLGRILLESAASIAREAHDSRLLARALTNLNADWTQDDAERAADLGREAFGVATGLGDHSWISSAMANALLAMLVSGEWDEAMALLREREIDGPNEPFGELVECHIACARGQGWQPRRALEDPLHHEDMVVRSVVGLIHSKAALERGDPAAALAVSSTHLAYAASGLFDDFTTIYRLATDIAWEAGDRAALEEIRAVALADVGNKHPTGLRAQEARLRGLLAIEHGEAAAVVESHFSEAVAVARQWRSPVAVARAQADLGVWLTHQGRAEEAADVLDEARATFERLGAVRWAEQLDGALAGVRA